MAYCSYIFCTGTQKWLFGWISLLKRMQFLNKEFGGVIYYENRCRMSFVQSAMLKHIVREVGQLFVQMGLDRCAFATVVLHTAKNGKKLSSILKYVFEGFRLYDVYSAPFFKTITAR